MFRSANSSLSFAKPEIRALFRTAILFPKPVFRGLRGIYKVDGPFARPPGSYNTNNPVNLQHQVSQYVRPLQLTNSIRLSPPPYVPRDAPNAIKYTDGNIQLVLL